MTDYLVTVDQEEIRVSKTDVETLDIIKINSAHFHVLQNNQAYVIRHLPSTDSQKAFKIVVNGNDYEVKIEDEFDQQVKKMGLLATTSQKVKTIKAPMPGLIIEVMVEVGQTVAEGTPILVLAAMKMENIILSQGAGIIKSIAIKKEDSVEKGQLIIEME